MINMMKQSLNDIARYLSGFYPKTARRAVRRLQIFRWV